MSTWIMKHLKSLNEVIMYLTHSFLFITALLMMQFPHISQDRDHRQCRYWQWAQWLYHMTYYINFSKLAGSYCIEGNWWSTMDLPCYYFVLTVYCVIFKWLIFQKSWFWKMNPKTNSSKALANLSSNTILNKLTVHYLKTRHS